MSLENLRKLRLNRVPLELVEDVNENPLVGTLFHDAYLEGFFDEHGFYPTGDEVSEELVVENLDEYPKKASA